MADVNGLIRDPQFQALPFAQRQALLAEADPDFGGAAPDVQSRILVEMKSQPWWGSGKQQPAPIDDVPEWGRKNPNLYGAYGAGKAIVRTGLEAGGQALGALGGGALGTLASPGAGTVTGGLLGAGAGYAGGRQLADLVLGEDQAKNDLGSLSKDVAFGAVTQGLGNLVSKGVTKMVPQPAIDKLYASAMKIPTTMSQADRSAFIKTGLSERAVPRETASMVDRWMKMKGHKQIMDKISSFNDEIENIISASARRGETVSSADVVRRLDNLIAKGGRIEKADPTFLNAITKAKNEFLKGADDIPIETAQELKRHIYKVYQDYYGMPDAVGAYIQGKKAIARGLKEEIETLHPEIKNLNMSEGALIKFLDPYNRAIGRIQNRDIIGLGMQIAPMTADALTGNVGGAAAKAGFMAKLIDTPSIKSRIAILLNSAKKAPRSALRQATGRVIPAAAIAGKNYMTPTESAILMGSE